MTEQNCKFSKINNTRNEQTAKRQRLFLYIIVMLVAASLIMACNTSCSNNNSNNTSTQSTETVEQTNNQISNITDASKPTVVVLSTGGTIAGSGEDGKATGYKSGAISGEDLIASVPQLVNYANIVTEEICNENSDDITSQIRIKIAKRINELSKDEKIHGFVITHGTDTMEETAYFLNLTVKTDKPVAITGSMRPATAVSADGPSNLLEAVRVAASDNAGGRGILCVFSDLIYPARTFTKSSSYAVNAMTSSETGAVGIVRDNGVFFFNTTWEKHTTQSEFDVSNATELPTVNTVYFEVDADPNLLTQALNSSQGVVINGAGAGEYSKKFKEVLEKNNKPVMITNHTGIGTITQSSTILPEKTVACNYLTSQKAQVLLRVCLLAHPNISIDELQRIAWDY